MKTRFLTLSVLIGFAGACFVLAQSPTPTGSPAKRRAYKKAQTTVAPAESPPPGHQPKKGTTTTTATAAPAESPPPGHQPKKGTAMTAAPAESPTPDYRHRKPEAPPSKQPRSLTPTPTPKFNLADLFKPRTSGATTSAAAAPAPARGASAAAATKSPAPGGGHGLVWVNTETHVYHREGSRFYGTTKKGKYMTEADAIKEGDKATKGHE
jgi:hypothetical protein